MDPRRQSRMLALQWLYQQDLRPYLDATARDEFLQRESFEAPVVDRARELIEGVLAHQQQIDRSIEQRLVNWNMQRLGAIERALLRLGSYEIQHCPRVPDKTAINEALELAKQFGTAESAKFINGILDKILQEARARVAPLQMAN